MNFYDSKFTFLKFGGCRNLSWILKKKLSSKNYRVLIDVPGNFTFTPIFLLKSVLELWSDPKEAFLHSFLFSFLFVLFHLQPSTQSPFPCCISSSPHPKYNPTWFWAHDCETCFVEVPLISYSKSLSVLCSWFPSSSFPSSLASGHYSFEVD